MYNISLKSAEIQCGVWYNIFIEKLRSFGI